MLTGRAVFEITSSAWEAALATVERWERDCLDIDISVTWDTPAGSQRATDPPTFSLLLDLPTEVIESVLAWLNFGELALLSRCSRRLRAIVSGSESATPQHLRPSYPSRHQTSGVCGRRIASSLAAFAPYAALRELMFRTGALVFGDVAVDIALGRCPGLPPRDTIDIVLSGWALSQLEALLLRAGYQRDGHPNRGTAVIFWRDLEGDVSQRRYERFATSFVDTPGPAPSPSTRPRRRWRCWVSRSAPLEQAMAQASTARMVWLTYDALYCIFPELTFAGRMQLSTLGPRRNPGARRAQVEAITELATIRGFRPKRVDFFSEVWDWGVVEPAPQHHRTTASLGAAGERRLEVFNHFIEHAWSLSY